MASGRITTPRKPPATKPDPKQSGSARDLAADRASGSGRGVGYAMAGAGLAVGGALFASLIGKGQAPDPFQGQGLQFPRDLSKLNHFITFRAKETKGIGTDLLQKGGLGSTVNGGSIRLPLPANLSTDYSPQYSPTDLGNAGAGEALSAADRAIYGNNDVPGGAAAGGAIAGAGLGLLGAVGADIGKAVAATKGGAMIGGALGGGDGVGAAALKVSAGLAQNPHKVLLFTGVNFREHQFSWKLSPRNRDESNAIKRIIDMFTYYAHPEYVSGALFFKYPEFFEIEFNHPEYLFRLLPSVLKDIRVNYHGQGYAAYIRDYDGAGPPAPAEVELSLTFQETEIITKQTLVQQMNAQLPIDYRGPRFNPTTQPPNMR